MIVAGTLAHISKSSQEGKRLALKREFPKQSVSVLRNRSRRMTDIDGVFNNP